MKPLPISESPKSRLRKEALALRASLPMPEISRVIREQLARLPAFETASRILFYHPFKGELDFLPLALQFPQKQWYLPVSGPEFRLTFQPYQPEQTLNRGAYGIQEPANAPTATSLYPEDLLIVPGLLFDRAGHRLGYGKGYFDRFLGEARQAGKECVTLGGVPEALLRETLPVEPWDLPVDWLVTEAGGFRAGFRQEH